jgi:hypothetical protein
VFGKLTYDGIVFHMLNKTSKTTIPVTFLFDLGTHFAIMGDTERIGWGIECTEQVHCIREDLPVSDLWYLKHYLQVKESQIHLRLAREVPVEMTMEVPEVLRMSWKLIVGPGEWFFEDWGVIGLSPSSVMTKYILEATDATLSFLPFYKRVNDELDFRLFLHPVINAALIKTIYQLPACISLHWAFVASLSFSDIPDPTPSETFCINSQSNDLLLFFNKAEMCFRIHRIICDGRFGSQCTRDIATIHRAPNITIAINDVPFDFTPDEYLQYEGNSIRCKFGDMTEMVLNDGCPANSLYGVGKSFFEKYPAVFTLEKTVSPRIIFLSGFEAPFRSTRFFWWLIWSSAGMTLLGTLIIVLLIRKGDYKAKSPLTESMVKGRLDSLDEHSPSFRQQEPSLIL